jgi:hypothetical protein
MFTWIMLSAIITKISFMKKTKNDRDGKKKGHEKSKGQSQKNEVPGEWKRAACFFEWFDAEGAKEQFWAILKLALAAGNDKADERERSNMIFFYEKVIVLLENVSKIWERKKEAIKGANLQMDGNPTRKI